jgi:hypothetical protein
MLSILAILACLAQQPPPPPAPPPQPAPKAEEPFFKSLIKQITIGGQARFRAEYRDPTSYLNTLPSKEDDDIYLSRLRLNLKFSVNDDIDVFIQPQDQRIFGDEASVLSDETNLDLHQGYAEIRRLGIDEVSVSIGRQELSYGDQRLVSPLDWSNIARAWDGVKVRYAPGPVWIEGFATVIKEGAAAEDDQDFYGLYFSYVDLKDHEFDLYVFGRELNDNLQPSETVVALVNDRRDWTPGARFKGKMAGFDYTGEGMLQRGTVGEDDIKAWAAAATLGYTLDINWKPRLGLEYTHASGDPDPTDGDIETFDPLFPFGHFYQGFADVFAFKNGRDIVVNLRVAPTDTLTVYLDVHTFRLDEEVDAWYNFAGAAIRKDATGNAGDEIGNELDLHARLSVGKNIKFWGGWSHVFAGDYIEDTPGSHRDMEWFFLQMTIDF